MLGGPRLQGGVSKKSGEQPRGKPRGLLRKRGLVGSGESFVCPQLPSLALAGHSLGVPGK